MRLCVLRSFASLMCSRSEAAIGTPSTASSAQMQIPSRGVLWARLNGLLDEAVGVGDGEATDAQRSHAAQLEDTVARNELLHQVNISRAALTKYRLTVKRFIREEASRNHQLLEALLSVRKCVNRMKSSQCTHVAGLCDDKTSAAACDVQHRRSRYHSWRSKVKRKQQ